MGAVIAALLVTAGVAAPASATQPVDESATVSAVPRPDHVVIVVEENHSAPGILGNPDAPYINSLAAEGANFTQSFAETHPSQPNYLALFSGSTQGVTDDNCPYTFSTANLGDELLTASLGFTGYSEDLPSVGYTGCQSGNYVRKHNPWADFTSTPDASNQPLTAFPTDYSTLPAVSFVMPDLQHDMHNGTIAEGDAWLEDTLGGYISWAQTHNSLFVLTFDEDDHSDNNQIPTVVVGGAVNPGNYSETINHYSVLRTIEDAYGLTPLGASADAAPILDIWAPPSGDQPPVAIGSRTHVAPALTLTAPGSWVVSYWASRLSTSTTWTLPTPLSTRGTAYGSGGGHIDAAVADSGGPQATGTYPTQTATENEPAGRGIAFSIVLAPSPGST